MKHLLKVLVSLFVGSLLLSSVLIFPQVTHATSTVRADGGFPPNASWIYNNPNDYVQAWLGPLENDAASGDHFNLHVQPPGGGYDIANYHITYDGIATDENGNDEYVWQMYDSVSENFATYSMPTTVDLDTASAYATSQMATDIGAAVGSSDLTDAIMADLEASSTVVDALVDALVALALLIVDAPTQQNMTMAQAVPVGDNVREVNV